MPKTPEQIAEEKKKLQAQLEVLREQGKSIPSTPKNAYDEYASSLPALGSAAASLVQPYAKRVGDAAVWAMDDGFFTPSGLDGPTFRKETAAGARNLWENFKANAEQAGGALKDIGKGVGVTPLIFGSDPALPKMVPPPAKPVVPTAATATTPATAQGVAGGGGVRLVGSTPSMTPAEAAYSGQGLDNNVGAMVGSSVTVNHPTLGNQYDIPADTTVADMNALFAQMEQQAARQQQIQAFQGVGGLINEAMDQTPQYATIDKAAAAGMTPQAMQNTLKGQQGVLDQQLAQKHQMEALALQQRQRQREMDAMQVNRKVDRVLTLSEARQRRQEAVAKAKADNELDALNLARQQERDQEVIRHNMVMEQRQQQAADFAMERMKAKGKGGGEKAPKPMTLGQKVKEASAISDFLGVSPEKALAMVESGDQGLTAPAAPSEGVRVTLKNGLTGVRVGNQFFPDQK